MTTGSGQSFQVRLVAESFPDVRNAQITVRYNPEQLVFDKAQPGDFFPAQAERPSLAVSVSPAAGTIVLKIGRDDVTAKGTGVLATLAFTTKGQGQAPLVVKQSNVIDVSGQMVPVAAQHGLIRIL